MLSKGRQDERLARWTEAGQGASTQINPTFPPPLLRTLQRRPLEPWHTFEGGPCSGQRRGHPGTWSSYSACRSNLLVCSPCRSGRSGLQRQGPVVGACVTRDHPEIDGGGVSHVGSTGPFLCAPLRSGLGEAPQGLDLRVLWQTTASRVTQALGAARNTSTEGS
jgi:hypothetical protein